MLKQLNKAKKSFETEGVNIKVWQPNHQSLANYLP
jgi:hypothetical protein